MTTDGVGIYIHIPFCRSKCKYCDFKSFSNIDGEIRKKYIDTLCQEIREYRGRGLKGATVFFGGGTPSLLEAAEMEKIVDAIQDSFDLSICEEFTIEANPKTICEEKLRAFSSLGVNRISVGLQSIHENELKSLGRIHTFDDFLYSYNIIKKSGIDNINIDLMYGIPYQTLDTFDKTLDEVISVSPTHISAYSLIIEEGTPFYIMRDELPLPTEDEEIDMYELLTKRLALSGYGHYEISNYAKEGYECRHNLVYWQDKEYIGVGLAAHSYLGGVRFSNSERMDNYLSCYTSYRNRIHLDDEDKRFEYAMMNLRLKSGLSLSEYEKTFNVSFLLHNEEKIERYISLGLMEIERDRIALTERGFYLSNTILSDLL